MRHSNLELVHRTNGNPQQDFEQNQTSYQEKELETKLIVSKRNALLESVKTQKAKNIISELYRPGASVGDGGTADMLRDEAVNGIKPEEKSYYKKAVERVREIDKTILNNLAPGDENILLKEKDKLAKTIELWSINMENIDFNKIILNYFNEIKEKYIQDIEKIWNDEEMGSTILIEDYLMPYIYKNLNNNKVMTKLSNCLEEILMKNDEFCEEVLYCAFFEKIHYDGVEDKFIKYYKTQTKEFYSKLKF